MRTISQILSLLVLTSLMAMARAQVVSVPDPGLNAAILAAASIHTCPLAVSLSSPQQTPSGAFNFALAGPPATYTIFSSPDLAAWSQLRTITNTLGAAVFTYAEATNSPQTFYRSVSQ